MAHNTRFSPEEDARLREMWAAETSSQEIARVLKRSRSAIVQRLKRLGVDVSNRHNAQPVYSRGKTEKTAAQVRRDHMRKVHELRHRKSLGFANPVICAGPSGSLFGAPIRAIEPETQALIDEALSRRAA